MVIFDVEKECDEWQRCPHCWHNDDNGLWCFATCGRYDEKGERRKIDGESVTTRVYNEGERP